MLKFELFTFICGKLYLFFKISSVLSSMLHFYFCVQITLAYCIELHTFKLKLLKHVEHWQIRWVYWTDKGLLLLLHSAYMAIVLDLVPVVRVPSNDEPHILLTKSFSYMPGKIKWVRIQWRSVSRDASWLWKRILNFSRTPKMSTRET